MSVSQHSSDPAVEVEVARRQPLRVATVATVDCMAQAVAAVVVAGSRTLSRGPAVTVLTVLWS
ncbi:MAG: hypothetical protein R2714_17465 [Microthrixaceae bacterium]